MTISVVTCCMNRNDQLAETIHQWAGRDWVDQIVVVDWSSSTPVAETLRDMRSDKISIIRAEGENDWILSYAYNLGVIHATGDTILKIDADCMIGDDVVIDCHPDSTTFYAGNWRSGVATGKTKSVNGQCFFTRAAFETVNGFSELIRGWGFDDEDFYYRLEAHGLVRREIPCDLLSFLDHSDDRRIAFAPPVEGRDAQKMLEQQPYVQQVKNIVVSKEMPWGHWFSRARYRRLGAQGIVTTVERLRGLEIQVPPSVKNTAMLHAGQMVLEHLGVDPALIAKADYAGIIDLFEQWRTRTQAVAA